MATVINQSELVKKALVWVDGQLRDKPALSVSSALDEAGARFNLSPKDSAALLDIFETARHSQEQPPH